MKLAVDASVLLDLATDDPIYRPASQSALRHAERLGQLIVGDVVWAETRAFFSDDAEHARFLADQGVLFEPPSAAAAARAGALWRAHRRSHQGRHRIIADFLVGAHALLHADALLTRDRGFYRRYFARLRVVDPTSPHA